MSLSNQANTYLLCKRFEEALKIYQQLETVLIDSLGSKHPCYMMNLSNIGTTLSQLGRYKEALYYHRKF